MDPTWVGALRSRTLALFHQVEHCLAFFLLCKLLMEIHDYLAKRSLEPMELLNRMIPSSTAFNRAMIAVKAIAVCTLANVCGIR